MTKEAILVVAEDQAIRELRRHNRFMHGWGVVCGLSVTAAPTSGTPWRVQIGSGYALGPYGDEIFVAEAVYFDLAACLLGGVTNPCEPDTLLPGAAGTSTTAYLAIKYSECLARPVQVAYSGCGCSDDPCQYSRIRDSFQIQCLPQLPELPPSTGVTLCDIRNGVLAPCPPSPTNPWVALAKIMLPSLSSTNISDSMIVTKGRPTILSTAVLQDQIIRCCCQEQTPPPSPVDLKSIQVRPSPSALKLSVLPPWGDIATLGHASVHLRLFLLTSLAFNLFAGTGYFFFSGVTNFGDWAVVIDALRAHWFWRTLLIVTGIGAYYAALLVVGTGLVRYVGVPRNEPRRLRKLTFIPYMSAALILCAGGLLNPIGIQLVWQSALPGAAGADSGLLWLRYYIPKKTIPERPSEAIGRSYVWITVAAILSFVFIFVLGRGITLHR